MRSDLDAHFARFQIAVESAQFLVRATCVFSFYHEGEEASACEEVIDFSIAWLMLQRAQTWCCYTKTKAIFTAMSPRAVRTY